LSWGAVRVTVNVAALPSSGSTAGPDTLRNGPSLSRIVTRFVELPIPALVGLDRAIQKCSFPS
jgi:hypothetical protein